MVSINTKPIHIDVELKKKIEFESNFCNTAPTIIEGSVRNINSTNISYIELHRIIVKGTTLLAFNYNIENKMFKFDTRKADK